MYYHVNLALSLSVLEIEPVDRVQIQLEDGMFHFTLIPLGKAYIVFSLHLWVK